MNKEGFKENTFLKVKGIIINSLGREQGDTWEINGNFDATKKNQLV